MILNRVLSPETSWKNSCTTWTLFRATTWVLLAKGCTVTTRSKKLPSSRSRIMSATPLRLSASRSDGTRNKILGLLLFGLLGKEVTCSGEILRIKELERNASVSELYFSFTLFLKMSLTAAPSPSTYPNTRTGFPPTIVRLSTSRLTKLFAATTHCRPMVTFGAIMH